MSRPEEHQHGSHLPALHAALETVIPGGGWSVVEFGSGHYSTCYLRNRFAQGRVPFFTVEHNLDWWENYLMPLKPLGERIDWHSRFIPELLPNWSLTIKQECREWGIVRLIALIDSAPPEQRVKDFQWARANCDIILVHDATTILADQWNMLRIMMRNTWNTTKFFPKHLPATMIFADSAIVEHPKNWKFNPVPKKYMKGFKRPK